MKVLITESKLFNAIYQYLDSYLKPNEIDWVYGTQESDDGDLIDYTDDENLLHFYKGVWDGEDYSDIVFNYLNVDYYGNEPSSKPHKDKAPIVEVWGNYGEHLDTMFGSHWAEPMKKWVQDKFNLPVKSVSAYY
jgi:hypothetical protein